MLEKASASTTATAGGCAPSAKPCEKAATKVERTATTWPRINRAHRDVMTTPGTDAVLSQVYSRPLGDPSVASVWETARLVTIRHRCITMSEYQVRLVAGFDPHGFTHKEVHMARIGESADLLKCSFCGKSQKQVQQLIAGPGVYICDECVELCNEIIEERLAEA